MQSLQNDLSRRVLELKKEREAVILAHNYQLPEVQDVADFVGDSLGLSRAAAHTDAPIIVFCGVHFMAETASIINPAKKVLIPDLGAGCSLVDSSPSLDWIRNWRLKHPNGVVVSYVNTTAAVKALSDYCCTSGNAVKIVETIPSEKEILFLPDMFLGFYVQEKTGRTIDVWPGECHVHAGIKPQDFDDLKMRHPEADFLIHPECSCVSSCLYFAKMNPNNGMHLASTEGMVRHVKESPKDKFVIATEIGILHRLKKEAPGKTFIPMREDAVCKYMKMITLEKVYRSLTDLVYEVKVPSDIAAQARQSIEKMLVIG